VKVVALGCVPEVLAFCQPGFRSLLIGNTVSPPYSQIYYSVFNQASWKKKKAIDLKKSRHFKNKTFEFPRVHYAPQLMWSSC
jgi:hypothetical protein